MVQTSLNIFDLGVILVIGLSALMSFFRGFTREVLSLGAWIIASIVTLYAFPQVSEWIQPQVKNPMVASGLASIGVFLITLVVISIMSSILLKFMKSSSEIGMIDNIMGLIFGGARGVLLVTIGYFIMTLVMTEKDYPAWVSQAATRPYIARSARWLAGLAPSYLEELMHSTGDKGDDADGAPVIKKSTAKTTKPAINDDGANLPSFEDLQQRLREENEKTK